MRLRKVKLPTKIRRVAGNALTGVPVSVIDADIVETALATDQAFTTSVLDVSIHETASAVDNVSVDAGIAPELPSVHFGAIGGPSRRAPLHGLAQGFDLVITFVLEPGRVYAALSVVADGANLVVAKSVTKPVTESVTVLGDSFHARITLDQGYAFGEKDWRPYNEKLLLVLAA